MLKSLYIKNFALIEELELDFSAGLNIITGETGAGKSVIVDAMMQVLGERSSADYVRNGESKAVVEGRFYVPSSHPIVALLGENELDYDGEELIVRREIAAKGSSRCFISDSPAQLNLLKEVGDLLVDFHGQHDHQLLLRREYHVGLLDSLAGVGNEKARYEAIYRELQSRIAQYKDLVNKEAALREKKDNYAFELNEIEKVSPKENEEYTIESELAILENAELIHSLSQSVSSSLYDNENSVRDLLAGARKGLGELSAIDPAFNVYCTECDSAIITVGEIAKFCSGYVENISYDSGKIEELRQRLSQLQTLRKKYGKYEAVLERWEYLKKELELIVNYGKDTESLKSDIAGLKQSLGQAAQAIGKKRAAAAVSLESAIVSTLGELGMANSVFRVSIAQEPSKGTVTDMTAVTGREEHKAFTNGVDIVEFLISTNKGEEPKPLISVASGGEVSRVMLALKSIAAEADTQPMLVFDEIDTGVSGRIAQKVGEQMKKLSAKNQIIAITHLPQIAAAGDLNISVRKTEQDDRTYITASKLSAGEKVEEIAKLFSGDSITNTAIKTARDLISSYK